MAAAARRAPTGWGTTQETAYAVIALTDYLRSESELNSSSTYRVYVNDQLIQKGTLSTGKIQQLFVHPGQINFEFAFELCGVEWSVDAQFAER